MSKPPDMGALDRIMSSAPVIPVLTLHDAGQAVDLASTLVGAGLTVLEVTLRTDQALSAIQRMVDEVPGATVGAGTVISADDLDRVAGAGGQFAISPGASSDLYERASSMQLPFLPGVATAGEVISGLNAGWRCFKLFPAASIGGIALLKSFYGPFPDVTFCPTGGIGPTDFRDYLALRNVRCVGGSWMVPGDAVKSGDWKRIEALAGDCVDLPTLD